MIDHLPLTDSRKQRLISVVSNRQYDLTIIAENIFDPHNVSAIFRTCDAVGIPKVHLLYNDEPFPKIGKKSSASAFKWVARERHTTVVQCYSKLREDGFVIYASKLDPGAVNMHELDFTKKVAIVMGNEHRGISDQAAEQADKIFYIPMYGIVQSLNVSVAAAVIMYEALRQRSEKHMYNKDIASDPILTDLLLQYASKK